MIPCLTGSVAEDDPWPIAELWVAHNRPDAERRQAREPHSVEKTVKVSTRALRTYVRWLGIVQSCASPFTSPLGIESIVHQYGHEEVHWEFLLRLLKPPTTVNAGLRAEEINFTAERTAEERRVLQSNVLAAMRLIIHPHNKVSIIADTLVAAASHTEQAMLAHDKDHERFARILRDIRGFKVIIDDLFSLDRGRTLRWDVDDLVPKRYEILFMAVTAVKAVSPNLGALTPSEWDSPTEEQALDHLVLALLISLHTKWWKSGRPQGGPRREPRPDRRLGSPILNHKDRLHPHALSLYAFQAGWLDQPLPFHEAEAMVAGILQNCLLNAYSDAGPR